ncbi:MAG: response regulator [Pseudobdellovibrio sp.]
MSNIIDYKKTNVLVVEDEPDLREILVYVLQDIGYNVFEAENGEVGLKVCQTQKIDAIISDIRMPKVDGVQLLKNMREKSPEIPVIFLVTGFADIKESEVYQLGANAFINKPYDINELTQKLEASLVEVVKKSS